MAEILIANYFSAMLKLQYSEAGGFEIIYSDATEDLGTLGGGYSPFLGWAASPDLQKIVFASTSGMSVSTDYGDSFTTIEYSSFAVDSTASLFSRMGYGNGTMYLYIEGATDTYLYTSTDCYTWTLQGPSTAFGSFSAGEVTDERNSPYYNGLFYGVASKGGGPNVVISQDFLTSTILSLPPGISLNYIDLRECFFYQDNVTGKVLFYAGDTGFFGTHSGSASDTTLAFSSLTSEGLGLGMGAIDGSYVDPVGFVNGNFYATVFDLSIPQTFLVVSSDLGVTFQYVDPQPTLLTPNKSLFSLGVTTDVGAFIGARTVSAGPGIIYYMYKQATNEYIYVVEDTDFTHRLDDLANFGRPVFFKATPGFGGTDECKIWNEQSMVNVRTL